jgi:hypothetical protein
MRPHLLAPPGSPATAPMTGLLAEDVMRDLRLDTVFSAMAGGRPELAQIARNVLLAPQTDPAVIAYRQAVLADCLRAPKAVLALFDLAAGLLAEERRMLRGMATRRPEARLRRALRVLELFDECLRRLREFADHSVDEFTSEAFTRLFATIRGTVDKDLLRAIAAMMERLRFEQGIVVRARLGDTGSTDFRLCEPPGKGRLSPIYKRLRRSNLTHSVVGQDEQNWRAMASFRDRVLADVADTTAGSAEHVLEFFQALHDELGFYLGCTNLAETLAAKGIPTCLPECRTGEPILSATGLRDPGLAMDGVHPVVGNDLTGDGTALVLITGANRGGKTTLLCGIGVAQLMMQSGMFVCAHRFAASIATSVHTHFKRAEDKSMVSGKLDEELTRMSAIADRLGPGSLLLCNESFMSTNDREGTEIAGEILRALTDLGVRVVFVTHLHTLASRFDGATLFLTAPRDRSFRLIPGTPSATAHAADLANRILGR